MQVTYREPVTDAERALLAAYHAEVELQTALGRPLPVNFMPRTIDYRRFCKTLKRERDANAVRLAHLAQRVSEVLQPVSAS